MDISFWKMHGASNDFIVVDDRQETFPADDPAWIASIMVRNTGVGSEGVLLIQPSEEADFRMRFFNPDGGEVDMCGNGARCIARLAHELGIAPARMRFRTEAGMVGAEICGEGDHVRLTMTAPEGWRMNREIELDGSVYPYHFVNTGVEHVVIELDTLEDVDVQKLGSLVRYHEQFAPKGTNANFVQIMEENTVRVRTYERGVEAETPACGTGMVASGLVAGKLGKAVSPVTIIPASGDRLEVGFHLTDGGAEEVTLYGPAEHVFRGILSYPEK